MGSISEDLRELLEKLHSILSAEREYVKRMQKKDPFDCNVIAVKKGYAVLKARKQLEEGTYLGYLEGDDVNELGYVVEAGKYLIVKLLEPFDGNEKLKLVEMENLLSYDVQLAILEIFMEEGKVPEVVDAEDEFDDNTDDTLIEGLDEFQSHAATAALSLNDNELMLVVGPPGTGKTRFISKAALLAAETKRILITSHTNRAVDNAIAGLPDSMAVRVGNPRKISDEVMKYSVELKAEKRLEELEAETPEEVAEVAALKARQKEREIMEILNSARIVGSTLIKCATSPMLDQAFDTVFIDESSQALISAAMIAMDRGKKFIVVGDPYQLPPVLKQFRGDASKFSAFTFFYRLNPSAFWLRRHYRSNSEIIGFAARFVYGGRIEAAEVCRNVKLHLDGEIRQNPILDPERPLVFVSVDGREEGKGSRLNQAEVRAASEICQQLIKAGVSSKSIGIITPYVRQKEILSDMLPVEVNTVDAFQGREKDVIIFSTTATSDLSFACERRRFNVALTRAKKKFIALCNHKSFLNPKNRKTLLYYLFRYSKEQGSFYQYSSSIVND